MAESLSGKLALLEVERVSQNSGLSGDSIQRVVQPTVTEDGKKSPGLKFGQPRVMALFLALTLFQHPIDGFHNHDLRHHVADLLGVSVAEYTSNQMTYELRRLRLKGLIYRPHRTNCYVRWHNCSVDFAFKSRQSETGKNRWLMRERSCDGPELVS